MAATSTPRPGRLPTLAKYEVIEEIGHGGMATVYRAHDKRLGRDVAVKVLHPHLRDSVEVSHRFSVEAKAVAKLRHANIVEVYDVSSEDEPEQYLVVELLRGQTLRKLLQKHGALPPEVGAALAIELLAALAHAHEAGVVHRDIKPENVIIEHKSMVSPSSSGEGATPRSLPSSAPGDRVVVKLTDFGIAKLLDAQGVTSTGQVLGSPAHMAPEQIEGGAVDARADVFGLGVLLYECMVGHLPFEGNNPAQVLRRVLDGSYAPAERERGTVGKRWSALLDRALAHRADARFADAAAMRDALLAELKRLGFVSARAELEAWFDDPDEYAKEHAKKLIKRLCDLGSEARKRGDALGAAADYNRALAYAPADPQLLKIVSTMHRAEARSRAIRRGAPLVLATLAVGVGAFYGTKAIRTTRATEPTSRPVVSEEPSISARPSITIATSVSAPPVPTRAAQPVVPVAPVATKSAPAKPVSRTITISTPNVANGVSVSVDGQPPRTAHEPITLDDKSHTLELTCVADMCEPVTYTVQPGDKDQMVPILVKIRDAKIVVDGNPMNHYVLVERGLDLRSGVAASISMRVATDSFRVKELESGEVRSVAVKAGQEAHVSFDAR
jgi:serine/threonine-protein kinase